LRNVHSNFLVCEQGPGCEVGLQSDGSRDWRNRFPASEVEKKRGGASKLRQAIICGVAAT
jgi:hypothetical protein